MKPQPADYFESPAASGETGGLGSYTCVGCGHRSASWAAFRAHRVACSGRQRARAPRLSKAVAGVRVGAARTETAAAPDERDPFLDAPPEALDVLERTIERAQDLQIVEPESEMLGPLDDALEPPIMPFR